MTEFLQTRDRIKQFYVRNEIYLHPLLKFLTALLSLIMINTGMGYMDGLKNIAAVLVVSLLCSLLPQNFTVIMGAVFILLHSYAMALECAIVVLAVFAVMFLLYFRFSPKDTITVLLTPILFMLKVPFVMPVALGLLGGPTSIASLSCGTICYYMIKFISDNEIVFSAADAETGSEKFRLMMDGILDNKQMFAALIIFALTLVVVYTIRRTSMDYSWTVAIFSGIAVSVLLMILGEFVFNLGISILAVLIGGILSLVICIGIQFMEFNVDYTRTEIVQFEDDEYYYYVKAVPKNAAAPVQKKTRPSAKTQRRTTVNQGKVQQTRKVNTQAAKQPVRLAGQEKTNRVHTIKTANGVSRTTESQQNMKKNLPE